MCNLLELKAMLAVSTKARFRTFETVHQTNVFLNLLVTRSITSIDNKCVLVTDERLLNQTIIAFYL